VKKEPELPCSPPAVAINCLSELSTQLQELFDGMQLSDVKFNVRGREFPAHKNILATRSKVFEAMFKHPTKENSTNQIEIEDIKPEVFEQLLRFIYTGKVPLEKLKTMAAGLFIAADKYLLDGLKKESENYLLRHMSPDNCIELLLNSNLLNSAELLKKEAVKFFRLHQDDVVATGHWEMVKKDNPALLCDIQEFVFSQSKKKF
jgi:speckle-type POZ protein